MSRFVVFADSTAPNGEDFRFYLNFANGRFGPISPDCVTDNHDFAVSESRAYGDILLQESKYCHSVGVIYAPHNV